jgi:hypothetical protein
MCLACGKPWVPSQDCKRKKKNERNLKTKKEKKNKDRYEPLK